MKKSGESFKLPRQRLHESPSFTIPRCDMTAEFFREYLRAGDAQLKRLLYAMNPTKFRTCEFLVNKHEARGDKIIIFSDQVLKLRLRIKLSCFRP